MSNDPVRNDQIIFFLLVSLNANIELQKLFISTLVILSEEDIDNVHSVDKLRGSVISALLIPKRKRYTFFETKVGVSIRPCLTEKSVISYY